MLTSTHRPLVLGQDIEFSRLSVEDARLIFSVKNLAAVQEFLANENLMKFLRDPFTLDENTGRRLEIFLRQTEQGHELVVARQLKPTTIREAAYYDVLKATNSYIAPYDASNSASVADWSDMLRGQTSVQADNPSAYPRGKNFVLGQAMQDVRADQQRLVSQFKV